MGMRLTGISGLKDWDVRISGFKNLSGQRAEARRECALRELDPICESENQQIVQLSNHPILKSLNSELLRFKDSASV
jgi:hypothetical protein